MVFELELRLHVREPEKFPRVLDTRVRAWQLATTKLVVELPAFAANVDRCRVGFPAPSCGALCHKGAPLFFRRFWRGVPPYNLQRFSERLAWSTPPNAYSLLVEEKRRAGARLLDLTSANPTETLADYPHQDIAQALGAVTTFRYEPDALGGRLARQTVAQWYREQGIPALAENIALTASTSEAYAVLFKLFCDPGDEVLVPSPSYPLFEYLAHGEAVKTVSYELSYDGAWFIDFASLERAISRKSKALIVVSPNNPTGSFLKAWEAQRLALLAEKHGLALISDEVFMTYPATAGDGDRVRSLIGQNDVLSFSLNGLSKAAGMPQMKLAWIAVNGPERERDEALAKLELLLDSYLSVATPVQSALPALLAIGSTIHSQINSRLRENRGNLATWSGSPVQPLSSEGGWSMILQVPNVLSEEERIAKLLAYDEIVVQPGYFYDMAKEAFVVVSLLTEPALFAEGMGKLKRLVARF